MRFNLRCGLPAPASLAGWLNSDVERLLSYVQFSKAKDSNRCTGATRLLASCYQALQGILQPALLLRFEPITLHR